MKVQVLDKKGKKVEELSLSPNLFGVALNESLIAQYLRVFSHNQRHGTASAKTRAEVSGGGKKPWAQKGLGRARVGSNRSPLWRHGGITHGPKPKDWALNFSKQKKKVALKSALSAKAKEKVLKVVTDVDLKEPKTKELAGILQNIGVNKRGVLVVIDKSDVNAKKSASNLSWATTALWENLNTYEVLKAHELVFTKNSVIKLQEKYANK